MNYPLELYQGQVYIVELLFTDPDTGEPYDLTGLDIIATVRQNVNSSTIILERSVDDGIELVDAVAGYAVLTYMKADTATLAVRDYSWDIWLITPSGPVPWVKPSLWQLKAGVTKPSQTP